MARYHITPKGPKRCFAEVRACPYGGDAAHFNSEAQGRDAVASYYKQVSPQKVLSLSGEAFSRAVTESPNWGSAMSDFIEEHIEANGLKPDQIEFELSWKDEAEEIYDPRIAALGGEQVKTPETRYFLEATPRYDEELRAFTNVYRLAWWNPEDAEMDRLMAIVNSGSNGRHHLWASIPAHKKLEIAFEAFKKESHEAKVVKANLDQTAKNKLQALDVLSTRPNVISKEEIFDKLNGATAAIELGMAADKKAMTGAMKQELARIKLEKAADNIHQLIAASENNLIGPYRAHERGLGFYRVDSSQKPYIEENLSSTYLRGHNVVELAQNANSWIRGMMPGDEAMSDTELRHRYKNSENKAIPLKSPTVLWTANTPDGARWELTLYANSEGKGSHRVRYFDPSTGAPVEVATPMDPKNGSSALQDAVAKMYGEASISKELKKDFAILDSITEGISRADKISAKAVDYRSAIEKPTSANLHDELFGDFSKRFGF